MLDQLVESKNTSGQNGFRNSLLLIFFTLMVTGMVGGVVWSLFARDLGIGGEDLELSNLVTPVPVPENEPPKPEPEKPEEKQVAKQEDNIATRKDNILALDESPPDKIPPPSAQTSPLKARPKGDFKIDPNAGEREATSAGAGPGRPTGGGGGGVPIPPKAAKEEEEEGPPPTPKPTPTPPPPTPKPTPPPPSKPISGGVLNGKATSLPKPPYPAAAKAVRASGAVSVQVTIDENGSVISASATSGHPLLRQAAESAARGARFSPTLLSGQKVKVTGVITYNFVAQ
jgi:TonB family protein